MNYSEYLKLPLHRKKSITDIEAKEGLWCVNWRLGNIKLYSNFYTCIDQACIFWSLLILPIFFTAQFLPISWSLQATVWSILSCIGITAMISWTNSWVEARQVKWVLYCWIVLMLVGVIVTDLSIFLGWGNILLHICQFWLGLSTIGYFCTGLGVRSRALIFTGIIHLLFIFILPYIIAWQFLTTGILMVSCLLILAEFQWDGL